MGNSVDFIQTQVEAFTAIKRSTINGDKYCLLLVKYTERETEDFNDSVRKFYLEKSLD
jgi:hypothetical protein